MYRRSVVLWFPLGPCVAFRPKTQSVQKSLPVQCIPSRWLFTVWNCRCVFGEPWCAAWGGTRHPWGCKGCSASAGGAWREPELALFYPYCLLGMAATPQAMPGILWEGHRAQLYDERHCQISRVVNSTELKFDLVLELNTPDPSSVEMIVIFCDVILGWIHHM